MYRVGRGFVAPWFHPPARRTRILCDGRWSV